MRQRVPYRRIGVDEAGEFVCRNDVLLFDVRDAGSFEQDRAEGAQHLTQANLSAYISGTPKSTRILIYCYHGHASQEYAQTFSDFGFSEVYSLDGGYEAWKNTRPHAADTESAGEALQRWLASEGFPPDNVNAVIANSTTPLMKAAHLGRSDIVRDLLAAGARVGATNADGNNALWLACVGDRLDVIDLLIEAGIDINNQNLNGATALMYASSSGKGGVVGHLLAKGADTTAETPDGFTALDMAASVDCLKLLRESSRREIRS